MLSLRPGSDNLDARQRLRAERIAIENRKQLLAENGFPSDYLTRESADAVYARIPDIQTRVWCLFFAGNASAEAYRWHTNKEKA